MDFGQASKPSPINGVAVVARADVVAAPDSVAVDLPPEQTVQSTPAGEAVHVDIQNDGRHAAERRQEAAARQETQRERSDQIRRRTVIEPQTGSIVTQEKNVETGETIQTIPDEATLKLRLYARTLSDRAQARAAEHAVERSA